jgi:hypothetical protein
VDTADLQKRFEAFQSQSGDHKEVRLCHLAQLCCKWPYGRMSSTPVQHQCTDKAVASSAKRYCRWRRWRRRSATRSRTHCGTSSTAYFTR